MKQEFIKRSGARHLTILFAGWGMDANPFKAYAPAESDFMVCYDYGLMSFDASVLEPYREVRIVGWSMGVWAAEKTAGKIGLPAKYTAINGTPSPIDGKKGIPPAIFYGTLDALSEATLHRFRRRMCGDAETLQRFLTAEPRRTLESLRTELAAIADAAAGHRPATGLWDEAYIGARDLIFPAANQKEAWLQTGAAIHTADAAHYDEQIFGQILR